MACDVCNDLGTYPIIDRFGTTRYEIRCPECLGVNNEELERKASEDQAALAQWQADVAASKGIAT